MSPKRGRSHAPAGAYATLVVRGRWLLLALVGFGVWAALSFLPSLAASGGGLSGVVGSDDPAIAAQVSAVQGFGLPLLARTAVVQRDPLGLDLYAQARAELRALAVDKHTLVHGTGGDVLAALAVPNSPALFPRGAAPTTTVVTYLFTHPSAGFGEQDRAARAYAATIDHPGDHLLGVTGTIPLQVAQGNLVGQSLLWVEIASVSVVALIVGLNFRSVVAPLVTLLTAGIAYVVADRLVGAGAELLGFAAPAQLQPILVALVLGVTTDYSIFFLSGLRQRLHDGQDGYTGTGGAVTQYLPIVLVAGLTVTAGLLSLLVAQTALFRAFGPALAVTVLTGLAVSVLLVPPLLAVLGRFAFWPSRFPQRTRPDESTRGASQLLSGIRGGRWVRVLTRRPTAAVATLLVVVLLGLAAWPLQQFRESVSPMAALPQDNPVRVAWQGAAQGFAPGVLSPTEVLINRPGITDQTDHLGALQQELAHQPGVAGVLGPGTLTLPAELREQAGLFLAPNGDAARFLVVFDADPLGAQAVQELRALEGAMPGALATSGLGKPRVAYAGDTALGLGLVNSTRGDLTRVALAVALVDLLLLALFLRALIAPLFLLAASFLAVGAALGLTTLLFDDFLVQDGLVFFVPFAAGVLLVSLGSDYNIFSVGSIWDAARDRELPDALTVAVPRTTRAIGAAGMTLAASFGFVALVPLAQFQELAFAMCVGVLLDTFLVRSVLVPSLITLFGRFSGWPGGRLRR